MSFRKNYVLCSNTAIKYYIKNSSFTTYSTPTICKNCTVGLKTPCLYSPKQLFSSATNSETKVEGAPPVLTKEEASQLILRLNDEERKILLDSLHEYNSKLIKDELEGQLAASKWRSKYGRPSRLPKLGDVDPTGTFCPVPDDWLKKKLTKTVPRPTNKNLIDLGVANSIPFIGFGFLDNFFMLIFGDYIDFYLGSYLTLTTMAAAALGNTISDILGIGSAFYVERMAMKVGFAPPKLSPMQMEMPCSRNTANAGRVLGVTLGCILGMCPLLFRHLRGNNEDEKKIDDLSVESLATSLATS